VDGVLSSMLRFTYRVEPVGKLTRPEWESLTSKKLLAGYGYDGESRPYAWIVQADGGEDPNYILPGLDDRSKYFPILAEEAETLGKGRRPWPPDLQFKPWPP
jgi:hypothetical protein